MDPRRSGTAASESARARMLAYAREVRKREETNRIRRISRAVRSTVPRAGGATQRATDTARPRRRARPSPSDGPSTVPRQLDFLDSPEESPELSPLSPHRTPSSSGSSSPEPSPSLAYHHPSARRAHFSEARGSTRAPASVFSPLSRLQRRRIMISLAERAPGELEAPTTPPPGSPPRQSHHSDEGAHGAPESALFSASVDAMASLPRARHRRTKRRASPPDATHGHQHRAAALQRTVSMPTPASTTPPSVRAALRGAFAAASAAKEGVQAPVSPSPPAATADAPHRTREAPSGAWPDSSAAHSDDQPPVSRPAAPSGTASHEACRRLLQRGWHALRGHATVARGDRHWRSRRLREAFAALRRTASSSTARVERALALRRRNMQRGVFLRLTLACAASIRREHQARAFAHHAALARHFRALSALALARWHDRASTSRRAMRQWRALCRRRRALRRPAYKLLVIAVERVRRFRAFAALRDAVRPGREAGARASHSVAHPSGSRSVVLTLEVHPVRRAFRALETPPLDGISPAEEPFSPTDDGDAVQRVWEASHTVVDSPGAPSPPLSLAPAPSIDGWDVRAAAALASSPPLLPPRLTACPPSPLAGCDIARGTDAAVSAGDAGVRRAGPAWQPARPRYRHGVEICCLGGRLAFSGVASPVPAGCGH